MCKYEGSCLCVCSCVVQCFSPASAQCLVVSVITDMLCIKSSQADIVDFTSYVLDYYVVFNGFFFF